MGHHHHKKHAPISTTIGILSLSSTRSLADDISGLWIKEHAEKQGHKVLCHHVVDDRRSLIASILTKEIHERSPDVMLLTGGTGISRKDVTIEAVKDLFSKELSAFGILFAQLSYSEIGASSLLSRATAGIVENTAVFCMPGSLNACKLACTKLIFPELGHIVKHMNQKE